MSRHLFRTRLWRYCICLSLLFTTYAMPVNAHELEQSHGISAVLHIAPDDNPYAGQNTSIALAFSSQDKQFDIRSCGCMVSVQTASQQLVTAPVSSSNGSPTSGHASLVFPKAGVYDLVVSGRASQQKTDLYRLIYRVRVSEAAATIRNVNGAKSLQIIMIGLTSLIILAVVAVEAIRHRGRYSRGK